MIRIARQQSIPVHHESASLRGGVRAAGWGLGVLGIVAGLGLAAAAGGWVAELLGPVIAVLGAVLLALVVRCRRFALTVGTVRLDLGAGPFRRTLAAGAVEAATRRPATGWRRLYAREEVLLRLTVGPPEVAVPSHRPAALIEALTTDRDGEDG